MREGVCWLLTTEAHYILFKSLDGTKMLKAQYFQSC
jgi:hypothetical protein